MEERSTGHSSQKLDPGHGAVGEISSGGYLMLAFVFSSWTHSTPGSQSPTAGESCGQGVLTYVPIGITNQGGSFPRGNEKVVHGRGVERMVSLQKAMIHSKEFQKIIRTFTHVCNPGYRPT